MVGRGYTWRETEPLARHVPRRVGGTCEVWVVVHRREALAGALARIKEEGWKLTPIGTASRVLVRDGGLAGAVLRLGHEFAQIHEHADGWMGGAAVSLARVGRAMEGTPLEALADQPGSLGASLKHDVGWGPWIAAVDVWSRGGVRQIAYDDLAKRSGALVVGATIRRSPDRGSPKTLPRRKRPWAVFEEPPRADLDRVLRRAGLAGTRLRDVLLPDVEPSSLTNLGGASAQDIDLLLRSVVERVKREQGVDLKPSIQWLGRVS